MSQAESVPRSAETVEDTKQRRVWKTPHVLTATAMVSDTESLTILFDDGPSSVS
jgi:hypothetical protein